GHSAVFYDGGRRALVAFNDGGVFDLNLASAQSPGKVSQFTYPGDRAEEGNAGFVSESVIGGTTVAAVSEEGWTPTKTSLKIDAPSSLAGVRFACDSLASEFDQTGQAQLAKKPNATISGQLVYVGRG